MKRLICTLLAMTLCIGVAAFGTVSTEATGANLLAGASYTYIEGDFFSNYTDYSATLLTDGAYRGDGITDFDDIYAVEGTTVEFVGSSATNTIEFTLENPAALESMYFRGFRRSGNRYTNIRGISVSSDGIEFTSATYTETATAIDGAPLYITDSAPDGVDQYFDVNVVFSRILMQVKYIRVSLNTNGKYICQLDEVEAYGSSTGKYSHTASVSLSASKTSLAIGEQFTVTVLLNDITTKNGIVGCDLPLKYDTAKLKLTGVSGIFPTKWNGTGIIACGTNYTASPYWLRALCNADDLAANASYNVTESGVFGFSLTFITLASGDAQISVDNDIDNDVYLLVANGAVFDNYGAEGATLSVNITTEQTQKLLGDVNLDGFVNSIDAAMILRYEAGVTDLSEKQLENGDYNGDGVVNSIDAAMILKQEAGL